MAVYNSSVGVYHDDSDITIINPSIMDDQAGNHTETRNSSSSSNTNDSRSSAFDGRHDYIFVDHNPQENAQQLEKVLDFYIRDLRHESNTQLDCDRQLITRLVDLIRPTYSNDGNRMLALDKRLEEIAALNDKRHVEQNEKIEHLKTEICQLNAMLCTAREEPTIYNDIQRNYSMFNTTLRGDSIHDYDQLTEIEDDAKRLHRIVQSQKDQINEIVTLISQTATTSTSLNSNDAPSSNETANPTTTTDHPTTPTPSPNFISTLLKRIQDITGQQDPLLTVPSQEPLLENHSPDVSPTQSLATLTLESLRPTPPAPQNDIPPPVQKPPQAQIDIPVASNGPVEQKKCPVCQQTFVSTIDDVDMYDHIDKCLFQLNTDTQPKVYECPSCNRKLTGIDEPQYLQHLSDCFNRDIVD